eukprot:TRINITY_DN95218_c0_g1_i1.p1 TRINITY_DN95218_c0_g1~~TRINITY_DN95218_c0_g1_i1.p1  ORF type:complete len:763 (-),score=179.96 TRINITY_DN95218_c0_g1_i1:426-2714(-)
MAGTAYARSSSQKMDPVKSGLRKADEKDVVGLKVGDVATRYGELPICSAELRLAEVAELLEATGQTAAAVLNSKGVVEGLITEGDILQSYLHGAPWDITVGEWQLGGGGARVDTFSKSAAIDSAASAYRASASGAVAPEEPLEEALPTLLGRRMPGGMAHRRELMLVKSSPGGYRGGVLSPLDLAQALAEPRHAIEFPGLGLEGANTVADIMVHRSELPSITPDQTVQQALLELLAAPCNSVLVADHDTVYGLVTPSDALWAFRNEVSRSSAAWKSFGKRPSRLSLQETTISTDARLQKAAAVMTSRPVTPEGITGGIRRHLVAVQPDSSKVVGIISPSLLGGSYATGMHAAKVREDEAVKAETQRQAPEGMPIGEAQVKEEESPADAEQPPPPKRRRRTIQRRKKAVKQHPVTIAEVAAQRETASCSPADTLLDAAEALVSSGRTAAAVINIRGDILGVLTENDMLAALVDGSDWNQSISRYLRGGDSRLPGFMVPALTLGPKASLAQAAAEMASMAEDSVLGIRNACHHLLVSSGEGCGLRLLSALDIARGMLQAASAAAAGTSGGLGEIAVTQALELSAGQVMKDRKLIVASCKSTDSLAKAFQVMLESQQNCLLVTERSSGTPGTASEAGMEVEEESEAPDRGQEQDQHQRQHGHILGLVTAADAVEAFYNQQRGEGVSVASWLQGQDRSRSIEKRIIAAGSTLSDACTAMAESGNHHLLVVGPGQTGTEIIGVLSALDIVCALADVYEYDVQQTTTE